MARPPTVERLNPKLEAVLARLCQRLGAITTTRAVKLPYLVDVVAHHRLGASITGGTHQTWDHGVVTREVWSYIQAGGNPNDPFRIKSHDYSETGKVISLAGDPDEGLLTPDEEKIVDLVAESYGSLDVPSLGKLTKSLNTHLDAQAWGRNHKASLDDDAYARLSASYQALCNRLPFLDLADEEQWGDPIDDPYEYLKRELGG